MLKVEASTQFKKDLKKVVKSGKSPDKLKKIIVMLENEEPLFPFLWGVANH
jgi:mRNA-degrading endonuclease YafQ of YafQ-DinJ toxin-antitoxin module